jgi:co-chaperonin GroES (HSP10)
MIQLEPLHDRVVIKRAEEAGETPGNSLKEMKAHG